MRMHHVSTGFQWISFRKCRRLFQSQSSRFTLIHRRSSIHYHQRLVISFFDAIFRPYEFNNILQQNASIQATTEETDLEQTYLPRNSLFFIGLLMWTSLVKMPNRRTSFTDSKIFYLPHFRAHTTRDRFQELFTMLHLANNDQITDTQNSTTL